MFDELRLYDD
jgi:hypothetical protein